jgi:hypothetical protein
MFSSEKPLPTFDELPAYKNFPGCAWAVWGPDDQLGTVNLLTEDVVKKAAEEEIKYVSFESGFFCGEADAMTALFLMKIGKDCFFELVRYIFFISTSILEVVREITYWKKTVDRNLLIIGCWLTLLFFVFPCR